MDLIACDIGNTRIKFSVFYQDRLQKTEAFLPDETPRMIETLRQFRQECGPQKYDARTVPVIASSVNSRHQTLVEEVLNEALDQKLLMIGEDFPLEMKVAVDNIEQLGSDRLVNAYAAYAVIEGAVVVADFGSATTIDCVNNQGIFIGGVILPGLGMAAASLNQYTDKLPLVDIILPEGEQAYGINTTAAIQKGIFYSAVGTLREMVERYATELGMWPQLIVTGGYGNLVAQKCEFVDSLVKDLCADGLYLAYSRFREQLDKELEI